MNTEEESGTGEYPEELIEDSLDSTLLSSYMDYFGEASPETPAYGSVMSRNDLELLLSELLGNVKVDSFGIEWILKRPGATEDSVRESYQFLRSKDISDTRIASNVSLLSWDQETLWNNYRNLEEMGLNKTRIASNASLLTSDQETLWNNYRNLEEMGLNKKQIASNVSLLSWDQETLWNNYRNLEEMGLNKTRIASNVSLLSWDQETLWNNYRNLEEMGLNKTRIASNVSLLTSDQETLWNNYRNLEEVGLNKKQIASNVSLLSWDQETLWNNYRNLEEMGLNKTRIASNASLLTSDQETLWNNYHNIEKMGISNTQIASNASLLAKNPKSVRSNYDLLVGLLRGDYADRNSGKEVVLNNPVLLTNSHVTVESSVQFLHSLGVDYGKNSLLLSTTVQKKREKMAWMLRAVFDYGEAPQEKKKDLIHSMHDMVRNRPNLLFSSVNYLEKRKDQLRETALEYLK